MEPSSTDLPILMGACHVFNTINGCALLWNTMLYQISQLFLRLDSWLRSDFLVREPLFRSWRKGVVYLMSALAHSQMQTVLLHSLAEWMRKEGRGWGNKEVMDKKKSWWNVNGWPDLYFFLFILVYFDEVTFDWVILLQSVYGYSPFWFMVLCEK